jgi:hypothetical protein
VSAANARIPLPPAELVSFDEPALTPQACSRLLRFSLARHERLLAWFLATRSRWLDAHPGRAFPGLCANVHPLTGEPRPDTEQRLWAWGDCRALSTWSAFLAAGRVPAALEAPLADYVEVICAGLRERLALNGRIPFTADPATNRADDHSANRAAPGGPDFAAIFAAGGFLEYGLWKKDAAAAALGSELFDAQLAAIDAAGDRLLVHGPRMILLGVAVEALKTPGLEPRLAARLRGAAHGLADHILGRHYLGAGADAEFWETRDPAGGPAVEASGAVVFDPGHATELAGFLAELVAFLAPADRPGLTDAALRIHLLADRLGFTPAGAMSKYVDLRTGRLLPDTQSGAGRPTAPWWNVREHCAAALRLHTLTADARLVESYRRAQRASIFLYPNLRIGGLPIQTIDPVTLEPLDIAPATGNIDPMHDARARMREIECLEILSARASST